MKRVAAIVAAMSWLSAGSWASQADTGHAVIVSSCVKGGAEQKVCECIATEMRQHVDDPVYAAMVLDAQGKAEEAQEAMDKLSDAQKFSIGTAGAEAAGKCGLTG